MSETPISPLRQRMIDDMSVRKFGEKTQKDYIRHVKTFSTFIGRSPATATAEDLRRFQVHQSQADVGAWTINSSVAALRFFFRVTLDRPDMGRYLTVVPLPERLRTVLSQEEVALLLEAAPGVKYKAALGVAYGAGLRVSEVANPGDFRHRQQTHVAVRRTGQGQEGSARDPLATAISSAAGLLVGSQAEDLAVPGRP